MHYILMNVILKRVGSSEISHGVQSSPIHGRDQYRDRSRHYVSSNRPRLCCAQERPQDFGYGDQCPLAA